MAGETAKPNIVILLIDTLRADRLGCYGYGRGTSPHIDGLAKAGVLYENAIATAPWTLPSHASLFTGLFPFEHGATDEHLYLEAGMPTLAELLSESGYETVAHSSDNAWLSHSTNLMRGFETVHEITGKTTGKPKGLGPRIVWNVKKRLVQMDRLDSAKALEAVEGYLAGRKAGGRPIFSFVNLMDVHMPYCPAGDMLRRFGLEQAGRGEIGYLQRNFREYRARPEMLSGEQMAVLRGLYDACVASVDRVLGRFLEGIMREGARGNTVVVVTSDHGECLGEHGLLNHWFSLCEELLRVPLILFYPGRLGAGRRIAEQVQQNNLFYTLLELAGYEGGRAPAAEIKGRSFLAQLERGAGYPVYTYAEQAYPKMNLAHIRQFNPAFGDERLTSAKQAVRSNEYKYIRYGSGAEELFCLREDPGETRNVMGEHPEIAGRFREQLARMRAAGRCRAEGERGAVEFEPEIAQRLRDLGYM